MVSAVKDRSWWSELYITTVADGVTYKNSTVYWNFSTCLGMFIFYVCFL